MRGRSDRALQGLLRLIERLTAADPPSDPEAALGALLEAFGLPGGWILWREDEEEDSFPAAAALGIPPAAADLAPCRCRRMAADGGLPEEGAWIPCEGLEGLGIPAEHLTIPLRVGGRLHGLVNLLVPAGARPEAEERRALAAAVRICGLFLGHLHACRRLRRQQDRLRILGRIARQAGEPLPPEDLLGEIVRAVVRMLGGDRGEIALTAGEGDRFRVVAEHDPAGPGAPMPAAADPAMAPLFRERRPVVIPAAGGRARLVVPLVDEGRVIGALGVEGGRGLRAFAPEDIWPAEIAAALAARAAARARRCEEARRQAAGPGVLRDILREAAAARDLAELLARALDRLRAALGAPMGGIWLEGYAALHGLPADARAGLAEAVRRGGHAVDDWAALPAGHPLASLRPLMERFGIRASLAVPLRHGGRGIGGMLAAAPAPRAWRAEEVELMAAAAEALGAVGGALRLREEMIQNVSHELRTPLAVALGYLELLAEGDLGPLRPRQREAVVASRRRLEELRRYVELLLTLPAARRGDLIRIPLDLRRLVEEVLQRRTARVDRTCHKVQVRLPAGPVRLVGDPEGLARAIGEVLDNAVKFSPQGGRIEVVLREEGGWAVLEVRDEGVGIPEEHLGWIGEPFYQAEGGPARRFGGMGIGLAVARAVVEAHGGRLILRPRSPRGAEARIVLPLAAGEDPRPPTAPGAWGPAGHGMSAPGPGEGG